MIFALYMGIHCAQTILAKIIISLDWMAPNSCL